MLSKLKKSNKEGFTIIEVMIVLAIAGLILLIVFLAVPALQRSSRNTQRKNDAAAVSAALGTYVSNSNGAPPVTTVGTATAGQVEFCNVICTGTTTVTETAKLGYYTNTSIFGGTTPAAGTTYTASTTDPAAWSATAISKNTVMVDLNGTCDDTTQNKVDFSSRSIAVVYDTEVANNGAGTVQCVSE